MTCWVAAVLVTAYPQMVNAAILTVTTNSDTGDDFTFGVDIDSDTADGAGLSLREALNWSVAGDTVTFNAGLAGSTVTLNSTQLTVNKSIVMLGDLDSNSTPDITLDGDNASIVISMAGLAVTARLDGFTIINGNSGTYGGGIYILSTKPTIINCIFSNNSAGHSGGAISNNGLNAAPVITNCVFSGNTAAANGGAMNNFEATVIVTNCVFSGNTATSSGGAMYNNDATVTVTNCIFSGNTATNNFGGAIMGDHGNFTVTNCTFSGNTANLGGGAMFIHESSPVITNCIFWGDTPDEIDDDPLSSPSITYSDVQGSYSGTGNINVNPLFVGGGDFHLQSQEGHWTSSVWVNDSQTSPCIDAGNPDSDFSNEPAPNGGQINMGAYGNTAQASKTPPSLPEINLKHGATSIADGGSYDFGSHEIGTDTDVTFIIENTGTANLTLTTPISLGGADANQLSIQQQPTSPVSASGNTTFIVRFTPTSAGSKTASLSISNNDADENPYNLALTAVGTEEEEEELIIPGLEEGKVRIQAGNDGWANPLRGENVNIYLKPKHSGNVSIEIYTIAGQLVWDEEISVTGGVQEQVVWNCRNKSDEVVSSGIYVVHVKGGGIDTVKKVAVVK